MNIGFFSVQIADNQYGILIIIQMDLNSPKLLKI